MPKGKSKSAASTESAPETSASEAPKTRSRRGFAGMDPEKHRKISVKGGQAAHESGNAHEFSREEAMEAGRKGGETVSANREHMAEIGRRGAQARRGGGKDGTLGGAS